MGVEVLVERRVDMASGSRAPARFFSLADLFLNLTFEGGFDGAFGAAGIGVGRLGFSVAPRIGIGDFVYVYGIAGFRPDGPGFSPVSGFHGVYLEDAHPRVGTGLRLVVLREERFSLYTALEVARLSPSAVLRLQQAPADLRVGSLVIDREGWGFAAAGGVRLPVLVDGAFQLGLVTELRVEHARWGDPKLRVRGATAEDEAEGARRLSAGLREDLDATGWAPPGVYVTSGASASCLIALFLQSSPTAFAG